jgi:NADH-quinone oxidoreductase subunit I
MGKIKITVDYNKCKKPEDCRLCLQVCSPAVFNLIFTDKDHHDPKNWKVVPVFPFLCIDCGLCVEKCPNNAITIKK